MPGVATQDVIRQRNLSVLLRRLHVDGALSRADLTAAMGLNRSTIKALVEELAAMNLVTETIPGTAQRAGRPSHVVAVRCDTAYVLAANVGVDTVTVAAFGLGGHILARRDYPLGGPGASADAVIARLAAECAAIRSALERSPDRRLVGIGVAIPGMVHAEDGRVEFAPNLMWRNVPFAAPLSAALDVDVPIRIGNDGDLGALAEQVRGAGRGVAHLVYIAGEVGIGGGIIVDGRLVLGRHGFAGEIGHVMVHPDGRPCRCGGRGCLETEVGEEAILTACGRDPRAGRQATHEVFEAARRGDRRAQDGLRHIAVWLGRGLGSIINVFDPEVVIIGGPLSSLLPLAEPVIREELAASTLPHRRSVQIRPPGLGEDSSLFGAAELAFERLLEDPSMMGEGAARVRLAAEDSATADAVVEDLATADTAPTRPRQRAVSGS
ncbi:ROK family protein [Acidothermus cellulolyticus 11B]|uniref:ROK family protein n=1 Tax=Acidothermus cellulolyticus (strain ATCC 43068 / DSM 8971 / 11B) TaxID=351607 RepID=A0LTZ1_ACIC1|nr:ROK family protein [Acidothermus cellulolyticus]ABK52901.1 ROK family protein [Acidothermus cellulolyticus 11B]